MISGGTPRMAKLTKRTSGVRLNCLTARSEARINAPAPSDVCELLPAVTLPLAANTGRSLASASRLRICARTLVEAHRAGPDVELVGTQVRKLFQDIDRSSSRRQTSRLSVPRLPSDATRTQTHPAFRASPSIAPPPSPPSGPCHTQCRRSRPSRRCARLNDGVLPPIGTMLIDSVPPAIITSASPTRMRSAAIATALQSGRAEAIDRHAAGRVRQPGQQHGVARHV